MKPAAITLEDLLDREAIRDVLTRYVHGVDRKNIDVLRTVFWPDAVEDHGTALNTDMEKMMAGFMAIVEASVVAVHNLSLPLIRLGGNIARVSTYAISHHRMEGQTQPHWTFPPVPLTAKTKGDFQDFFAGNRYIDLMEKREGEWRIKYRQVAFDWFRVVEGQSWANTYPFRGYEHFQFGSSSPDDIETKLFKDAFFDTASERS